jgi:lysophospholipase L1-like esterase
MNLPCLLVLGLSLAVAAGCAAKARDDGRATPALAADFQADPLASGWTFTGGGKYGASFVWSKSDGRDGGACLAVLPSANVPPGNGWESPPFPVSDRQYYRVTFGLKSARPIYWATSFYDSYGAMLEGDHHSQADAAEAWTPQEFCVKTKFPAATASVVFRTAAKEPMYIDRVAVTPISHGEARAWADRFYSAMTPLVYAAPEGAGRLLPRTLERLRAGRPLRIVVLGDSIANDLSNSPLDVLLEGAFPGCAVDVCFTGRGGTGWMKHRQQIAERVARHEPDLVILLAISNEEEFLASTLGDILDGVRRLRPQADILLVTPHLKGWSDKPEAGLRHAEILRGVAADKHVEILDLGAVWNAYLAASGRPQEYLLRDAVHMNERGRQVSARAVVAHLAAANPQAG